MPAILKIHDKALIHSTLDDRLDGQVATVIGRYQDALIVMLDNPVPGIDPGMVLDPKCLTRVMGSSSQSKIERSFRI